MCDRPPDCALDHVEIDTRDELIAALEEAAELEHGLMLQYLFAAFSARTLPAHHSDPVYLDLMRDWLRDIYTVSRQEMAHLATVCNLLAAVGGAPHFTRPPFPGAVGRYFPDIDFSLDRLSAATLHRFIQFEAPEAKAAEADQHTWGAMSRLHAQPDRLTYKSVGGLYRLIKRGFDVLERRLGRRLFIGAADLQDDYTWTVSLKIRPVVDLPSARAAIDAIVLEGEGAPGGSASGAPPTHFERFSRSFKSFEEIEANDREFTGSHPVGSNPTTRSPELLMVQSPCREIQKTTADRIVTELPPESLAYECAELFNAVYTLMLLLLSDYFDPASLSSVERRNTGLMAKQLMSGLLRPLGEILATLPVGRGVTAGAPFEVYGSLRLPSSPRLRVQLLQERVGLLARVCRLLTERASTSNVAEERAAAPRLRYLSRNLELLFIRVHRAEGAA